MTGWQPIAKASPFLDCIGPFWQREVGDCIEISVVLEEKHCNARGLAHGGLIASLCDLALGHNVASRPDSPGRYLTTSLNVDYVGAARAGERLVVSIDRARAGKTLGFAQATVSVDDRWVARTSGVFTAQQKPSSASSK